MDGDAVADAGLEEGELADRRTCCFVGSGVGDSAEPREERFDVALSNSFGFGGTNAALVLRRP